MFWTIHKSFRDDERPSLTFEAKGFDTHEEAASHIVEMVINMLQPLNEEEMEDASQRTQDALQQKRKVLTWEWKRRGSHDIFWIVETKSQDAAVSFAFAETDDNDIIEVS